MTAEKAKLKQALLESKSAEFADRATLLEQEALKLDGAEVALNSLGTSIATEVGGRLKTELDEGKVDEETGKAIARYLKTCANLATHLATQARSKRTLHIGRAREMQDQAKAFGDEAKREAAKLADMKKAGKKSSSSRRRAVGTRAETLKQQRTAKPAKKKSAKPRKKARQKK